MAFRINQSGAVIGRAFLIAVLALVTSGAAAQDQDPGYFPIERLDIIPDDEVKIDINLQGAMLRMIAAVEKNEPELGELVAGLERIRVRMGEIDPGRAKEVRAAIARATTELEEEGWQMIVRARGEGEDVALYVKERPGDDGSDIAGLTLFVIIDEEQVGMINIVGRIDPERIAELPILEDLDLGDTLGDAGEVD
jgi:ribosomal protein L29